MGCNGSSVKDVFKVTFARVSIPTSWVEAIQCGIGDWGIPEFGAQTPTDHRHGNDNIKKRS
jgi:hypothetical protein